MTSTSTTPIHPATYPNVRESERLASVAGGAMLALYGLARRSPFGWLVAAAGGGLIARGLTGRCAAYRRLGIDTTPQRADKPLGRGRGTRIAESIVIEKPPRELYAAWRNLEFLGDTMSHLASVTCLDERRSHWKVNGPIGTTVEWDAEIIRDVPEKLIGWSSLPGSDVDCAGSVHFSPRRGGRATEVKVVLRYDPPGGALGTVIASAFGENPSHQIRDDLLRLRSQVERGETPHDAVQEASEESFPASDPPSFTPQRL